MDLANLPGRLRQGRVDPRAGRAAFEYLAEAVRRLRKSEADALVTAPVSKEAIASAGIPWSGHTEFFGKSFQASTLMMLVTKGFRVSLATNHVAMRELPGRLKRAKVLRALRMTRQALVTDFGIRAPRLGLAALNPHGGEGGLFGKEEREILLPTLRTFGKGAVGPLPADSLMRAAREGAYDAVVALYHDQALIPVKLIGWEEAVNVTLGLPFVRTSPVHGTAFDLVGRGRADPRSMQAAVRLTLHLARRRASQR